MENPSASESVPAPPPAAYVETPYDIFQRTRHAKLQHYLGVIRNLVVDAMTRMVRGVPSLEHAVTTRTNELGEKTTELTFTVRFRDANASLIAAGLATVSMQPPPPRSVLRMPRAPTPLALGPLVECPPPAAAAAALPALSARNTLTLDEAMEPIPEVGPPPPPPPPATNKKRRRPPPAARPPPPPPESDVLDLTQSDEPETALVPAAAARKVPPAECLFCTSRVTQCVFCCEHMTRWALPVEDQYAFWELVALTHHALHRLDVDHVWINTVAYGAFVLEAPYPAYTTGDVCVDSARLLDLIDALAERNVTARSTDTGCVFFLKHVRLNSGRIPSITVRGLDKDAPLLRNVQVMPYASLRVRVPVDLEGSLDMWKTDWRVAFDVVEAKKSNLVSKVIRNGYKKEGRTIVELRTFGKNEIRNFRRYDADSVARILPELTVLDSMRAALQKGRLEGLGGDSSILTTCELPFNTISDTHTITDLAFLRDVVPAVKCLQPGALGRVDYATQPREGRYLLKMGTPEDPDAAAWILWVSLTRKDPRFKTWNKDFYGWDAAAYYLLRSPLVADCDDSTPFLVCYIDVLASSASSPAAGTRCVQTIVQMARAFASPSLRVFVALTPVNFPLVPVYARMGVGLVQLADPETVAVMGAPVLPSEMPPSPALAFPMSAVTGAQFRFCPAPTAKAPLTCQFFRCIKKADEVYKAKVDSTELLSPHAPEDVRKFVEIAVDALSVSISQYAYAFALVRKPYPEGRIHAMFARGWKNICKFVSGNNSSWAHELAVYTGHVPAWVSVCTQQYEALCSRPVDPEGGGEDL